jgi:hypothetical protein
MAQKMSLVDKVKLSRTPEFTEPGERRGRKDPLYFKEMMSLPFLPKARNFFKSIRTRMADQSGIADLKAQSGERIGVIRRREIELYKRMHAGTCVEKEEIDKLIHKAVHGFHSPRQIEVLTNGIWHCRRAISSNFRRATRVNGKLWDTTGYFGNQIAKMDKELPSRPSEGKDLSKPVQLR